MMLRAVAMLGWLCLLAASVGAQDLDDAAVEGAIRAGQDNKFGQWSSECQAGVSLSDKRKDQGFGSWGTTGSVHFTGAFQVTILTNSGRIALLAAEAKRQRKPFGVGDVPEQFRRQALYVLVDPKRPGRDWGSGVEVPSPITGIVLRSKSAPASLVEPTSFEVSDVQWSEGPTIMMKGKGGRFEKNLFERSRATATIPMESARVLPAGDLEIAVVTTGSDRRCDVAAKERLRLFP
jgi:hypothetical protein